ncbi:P2X purinoceptor 7-like [Haemaphysalis longicornis]
MNLSDLSDVERSILSVSESLKIVPYWDTPREEPAPDSAQDSGDSGSDRGSSPQPESPPSPDDASWCQCGQCHPMPTAVERLCCRGMPQCSKRRPDGCITTDEHFFWLCLDVEMLRVAYCELHERGEEPEMDVHKRYRYVAYRQFTRWMWGRLSEGDRKVIPSCAVSLIRKMFPSEQYCGFKYPDL